MAAKGGDNGTGGGGDVTYPHSVRVIHERILCKFG